MIHGRVDRKGFKLSHLIHVAVNKKIVGPQLNAWCSRNFFKFMIQQKHNCEPAREPTDHNECGETHNFWPIFVQQGELA